MMKGRLAFSHALSVAMQIPITFIIIYVKIIDIHLVAHLYHKHQLHIYANVIIKLAR